MNDAPRSRRRFPRPPARWLGARARWLLIWGLIALWLVALALDLGGNLVHLLLVAGLALLVYELLGEGAEA